MSTSTFAPLRSNPFRRLWLANTVSNLGFWMQQVAAAWLMTELTHSPSLVALLATAAALPTFLFALPAGALADIVDRRRLIIVTQVGQMVVAAGMGLAALAGAMTPALLLAFIAVYGLGNTLGLPPQSAILPEIVSAEQLTQAIALNGVSFTAAQAVGPAIGGAIVAAVGPGWAFIANAASFAGVVAAFVAWRRQRQVLMLPPEHMAGAIRSGLRYVAHAPAFRVVLVRMAAYMLCYAAFPALLVVVVRTTLHSSVGGFGVALGVFGAGAVLAAAFVLPRVRLRLSIDTVTVGATIVVAATVFFPVAVLRSLPAALPGLFVGGGGSMLVMSALQATALEALPDWVRGRGLAIVQLTFQAAVALGAAGWGVFASAGGTSAALIVAGAALIVSTLGAIAVGFRLKRVKELDLRPAVIWAAPDPGIAMGAAAEDGPVMALVEYDVSEADSDAFHVAMRDLAQARRRNGAFQWALATDTADQARHVESYLVSSWVELERERTRMTETDARAARAVLALHRGSGPPSVRILLGHHRHAHLGRSEKTRQSNADQVLAGESDDRQRPE